MTDIANTTAAIDTLFKNLTIKQSINHNESPNGTVRRQLVLTVTEIEKSFIFDAESGRYLGNIEAQPAGYAPEASMQPAQAGMNLVMRQPAGLNKTMQHLLGMALQLDGADSDQESKSDPRTIGLLLDGFRGRF